MKRVASGVAAAALVFSTGLPALPAKAATETIVHSLCSQRRGNSCKDGQNPVAGLIYAGGTLYGTTVLGGDCPDGSGRGTVFSLSPQTGAFNILHSFCGPHTVGDGSHPGSAPTYLNGSLYGTTPNGGHYHNGLGGGLGTAYSLDLATGLESVLYRFRGRSDGAIPENSPMIKRSGLLYGTTGFGGQQAVCTNVYGCGTVFSLDPSTGAEKVLYSFCSQQNCADGEEPFDDLNLVNDTMYGAAALGGEYSDGVVFSLNPESGTEKVVYAFCSQTHCADGSGPLGSLINLTGSLYGVTGLGGDYYCGSGGYGCGTVFSISLATGTETVLHAFSGGATDGWAPSGSVLQVGNILYGVTLLGGDISCGGVGCGTVYSVDTSTGAEEVIYSFGGGTGDGADPFGELVDVKGILYGTTESGGAYGGGTVFAITP
jgi:uncharacterized repeat protein (TIGR03803 family)